MHRIQAAILLTLLAAPLIAQTPEILYLHGNIFTGETLHAAGPSDLAPRIQAIAIANGKIIATGTDAAMQKLAAPSTRKIDLHGAFVLPGFNDAHTHMTYAGLQKLHVDLTGVRSLAEMQTRIRAAAASLKPGQWIEGGGWDHTLWPTTKLPTRHDLDAATGNHPAILTRVDEHIAIVNTAALSRARITATTAAPTGSQIDHDSSGEPTGILREQPAINLVLAHIPPPSPELRQQAFTLSMKEALASGVTTVQAYCDPEDLTALKALEAAGSLHIRTSAWRLFDTPLNQIPPSNDEDPLLHLGPLKAFLDGSLGSRTAALEAPYSDDPKNLGVLRYDQQKLNALAAERAQYPLTFHAIGDRANTIALNAFASIHSTAANRNRIEHAQVLLPADFDRFHELGIIASMQPSHLLTDMNWATDRLGNERAQYAYAWRSMLDHHIPLAFGTDYPVESLNPFRGLYAAITRANELATRTFHLEQRISLAEALYAYTQGSAYAERAETTKGRLTPGQLADFVILDHDITHDEANPQALLHTRVLATVLGGNVVYGAIR